MDQEELAAGMRNWISWIAPGRNKHSKFLCYSDEGKVK